MTIPRRSAFFWIFKPLLLLQLCTIPVDPMIQTQNFISGYQSVKHPHPLELAKDCKHHPFLPIHMVTLRGGFEGEARGKAVWYSSQGVELPDDADKLYELGHTAKFYSHASTHMRSSSFFPVLDAIAPPCPHAHYRALLTIDTCPAISANGECINDCKFLSRACISFFHTFRRGTPDPHNIRSCGLGCSVTCGMECWHLLPPQNGWKSMYARWDSERLCLCGVRVRAEIYLHVFARILCVWVWMWM